MNTFLQELAQSRPDPWGGAAAAYGALFQNQARTMVGLSNLRSGLHHTYPSRVAEACLYMLAGAGLSYALADVLQPEIMEAVRLINQVV